MFFRRLRERWVQHQNSGVFRHIPLDTKGQLYASPMPFGAYDRGSRLIKIYKQCHIEHVLMVITDAELDKKSRRNLRKLYLNNDISCTQFSIKDFQAPSYRLVNELVNEALCRLSSQNIVVHCHAGVGRTGIAVCCIVKAVKKCSADEAIEYAKKHMEINMTAEQIRIIHEYERSIAGETLKDRGTEEQKDS